MQVQIFIMIAESCYVLAEEYCSLYRTQISYRGEFVFEEEDPSNPETHIAAPYDILNNPDHQLAPHKHKVYLEPIRN